MNQSPNKANKKGPPSKHSSALPQADEVALFQKALALHQQGELTQANAIYEQVLAANPRHFDALHLSGVVAHQTGNHTRAVELMERSININPHNAVAHNNLGNALHQINRSEDALASYDRAIGIKADHAEAYNNRGLVLQELKRLDEALTCYDKAIAINPSYVDAHWNKSLGLLLWGKFSEGWSTYEWRWHRENFTSPRRNFVPPLWLGVEDLAGKTILLHAEQGFGDTIQFCRYARMVKNKGARVVLEVPDNLMGLLSGLEGVDELVQAGQPLPAFDYHCPLMSLPLAFKTDLTSIPFPQPYLAADSDRRDAWAQKLGPQTKPRIGLAWSGRSTNTNDHNRSLALKDILAYLPQGFDYVSLQKEVRETDKTALASSGIQHFGEDLKDFTDTAALCDLMDLVISVDTSVVHLAAAMGKPTWVMLPYISDWRWLLDRTDSPWYESVKLYRQDERHAWLPVLARVAQDLKTL